MSRRDLPKPFLTFGGQASLLEETLRRVTHPAFAAPLVICAQEHSALVQEEARRASCPAPTLLIEKTPRGTASAAALAALYTADTHGADTLLLLAPADHQIADREAFIKTVQAGHDAARAGAIVTFGRVPERPRTGFGYLHIGAGEAPHPVHRFVEKPEDAVAEALFSSGEALWNTGLFLTRAGTLLAAFRAHAPEILTACERAHAARETGSGLVGYGHAGLGALAEMSIDRAVMEKAEGLCCIPFSGAWRDLGSWSDLADTLARDDNGNAMLGDAVLEGCDACLAISDDGGLLALAGMTNTLAVSTGDSVLVAPLDAAGADLRSLVARLRDNGRSEPFVTPKNRAPWGLSKRLAQGPGYCVKSLVLEPGGHLSRQRHRHRCEHWIVVEGTGQVELDGKSRVLTPGESLFIPVGSWHRLGNTEDTPLRIIEVQFGDRLDEADIERDADLYGRSRGTPFREP